MRLDYQALENTNTKTRRLAYLTAIIFILGRGGLSERILLTKLVEWGQRSETWLKNYWIQTGEVTSTYRNSAGSRYLQLATNLGLVALISGVYRVTRIGLVLWELVKDQPHNRNPFYLTKSERLFYAHLLLERDADILLTVTDYLLEQPGSTLSQLQHHFQTKFKERLSQKIGISQDERLRQQLSDRYAAIGQWRKPDRYAEHIVPPRLNWLLDLEALEPGQFRRHRYYLTEPAKRFFGLMLPLNHSSLRDITDRWLKNDFWLGIPEFLDIGPLLDWSQIDEQHRLKLTQLLAESFKRFQYTTIPKVSLTQVLRYLSIKIILDDQIVASPTILENWFQSSPIWEGRRYEVRLAPRENESYLISTAI